MLALSRKKNEAIIISNNVEITILEVKGDQTKQNFVKASIGNAFMAFATFGINTYRDDLCYFSIGDPPLHWNLAVAYHKKHPPSIQAQKLIQTIREIIAITPKDR